MNPPKFLSAQEVYRILQRESPEGVYADGAPGQYFTTADNFSAASGVAAIYQNLERVYENFWPQTANEKIADWENYVFGAPTSEGSLSLSERRLRVINQLRARPSLALWEILTLVANLVPPGTYVQVQEVGCSPAFKGWRLGESKLNSETAFGWGYAVLGPNGADLCQFTQTNGWRLGSSSLAVTTRLKGDFGYEAVTYAQMRAYLYAVRIFGYTLTASERAALVQALRAKEPARSSRLIYENQDLADFNLTTVVNDVSQFDLVDCIKVDAASVTGYSGRTNPDA